MKENLHDIDKLFKAALDDHSENPPVAVWDAIDKNLDKNIVIDINRKYIKVRRIAIALLVLLLGAGIYTLMNLNKSEKAINNYTNNTSRNEALIKDLEVLDRAYDEIDLEYLEIQGVFGPEIIDELSKKWRIPKNFMFIGSPGNKFSYRVSDLGGVRLIM